MLLTFLSLNVGHLAVIREIYPVTGLTGRSLPNSFRIRQMAAGTTLMVRTRFGLIPRGTRPTGTIIPRATDTIMRTINGTA